MSPVSDLTREARNRASGALLAAGGIVLVGAAAGIAAQRLLRGRGSPDDGEVEDFGTLRGAAETVATDDGAGLHVEIDTPPEGLADDGLTLVFSHGFALSQDSWHFQRRDLRGTARLVFWDQRGHGRSERGTTRVTDIAALAEDLALVLTATCPRGEVILIGHSMGAMGILALAARRPELFGTQVRGVALLAGTAGGLAQVPLGLPAPAARIVHRIAPRVAATVGAHPGIVTRGRRATVEIASLVADRYAFGAPVSRRYRQLTTDLILGTRMEVIAELLPAFDTFDGRPGVAALNRVETVVAVGERDLMTPPEHSERIVAQVPGAEFLRLPATGHLLMIERPAEINLVLRGLVARVRRNRRAARRWWARR